MAKKNENRCPLMNERLNELAFGMNKENIQI